MYAIGCGRNGRLGRSSDDDTDTPVMSDEVVGYEPIAVAAGGCYSLILVRCLCCMRCMSYIGGVMLTL